MQYIKGNYRQMQFFYFGDVTNEFALGRAWFIHRVREFNLGNNVLHLQYDYEFCLD